jgi:hypothetical protein
MMALLEVYFVFYDCYADYAGWSFAFAGTLCWILSLVILYMLAGWLGMLCCLIGYVYGGWLPMFSKLFYCLYIGYAAWITTLSMLSMTSRLACCPCCLCSLAGYACSGGWLSMMAMLAA